MSGCAGSAGIDDHRESILMATNPTHNVKFNRLQHWPTVLSLPCRYRQMSGRAGRAGIDDHGESILIATNARGAPGLATLMGAEAKPIESCLIEGKRGMKRAMLEVVASGAVCSPMDVQRYIQCTLLAATSDFQGVVASATKTSLRCLGKATLASGMTPEDALLVKHDLSTARDGFVMATDLHLTFLITPVNEELLIDWHRYHDIFQRLGPSDLKVAESMGVRAKYVMDQHLGHVRKNQNMSDAQREIDRLVRRFLCALALNDLIQEMPMVDVQEKYGMPQGRGALQGLQERATKFASMVAAFCERLGWADLEVLVTKFQGRVFYGVRQIVALTEIPYVKAARARMLYKAGLRTPEAVAAVDAERVYEILCTAAPSGSRGCSEEIQRRTDKRQANLIVMGARELLSTKAKDLSEQAAAVLAAIGNNPSSQVETAQQLTDYGKPPKVALSGVERIGWLALSGRGQANRVQSADEGVANRGQASGTPGTGGPTSGVQARSGGVHNGGPAHWPPVPQGTGSGGQATGAPAPQGRASGGQATWSPALQRTGSEGQANGGPVPQGEASGGQATWNPALQRMGSGAQANWTPAIPRVPSGAQANWSPAPQGTGSGGQANWAPAPQGTGSGGQATCTLDPFPKLPTLHAPGIHILTSLHHVQQLASLITQAALEGIQTSALPSSSKPVPHLAPSSDPQAHPSASEELLSKEARPVFFFAFTLHFSSAHDTEPVSASGGSSSWGKPPTFQPASLQLPDTSSIILQKSARGLAGASPRSGKTSSCTSSSLLPGQGPASGASSVGISDAGAGLSLESAPSLTNASSGDVEGIALSCYAGSVFYIPLAGAPTLEHKEAVLHELQALLGHPSITKV
eukprot:gene2967-12975_t